MADPRKQLGKSTPGIKITGVQGDNTNKKNKDKGSNGTDAWRMGLSPQFLSSTGLSDQVIEQDWLNDLKKESSSFIKTQIGSNQKRLRQEAVDRQGIEVIIDRLFSCFQGFMYEFNKVAVGTDLHVSGTISGEVTEITRYNKFREAEVTETYFRARLSTRIYSLVIRGQSNQIDFFLLPVTRAMALSTIENQYPPLATIEIRVSDDGIMWRPVIIDPSCDSLESLCGWLFKQLVEETKAAISDK
jgi:hypothetical protein